MSWILRLFPFLGRLGGIQIYAIVAGVAFAAGAWGAYKITAWRYDAGYAKALKAALDDQEREIKRNQVAEIKYIEVQGKERIVYKTQIKKVVEYVKINPDHECFDDNGLQLYREALAGSSTRATANPLP